MVTMISSVEQYDQILRENTAVFADFYADWCGPCRRVAPVLQDLAKRYKDEIVIYKINVDKERELAGTFGVSSIPTIIFVPMKGEPQVSMGAMPEESFVKMIEEVLLEKKK